MENTKTINYYILGGRPSKEQEEKIKQAGMNVYDLRDTETGFRIQKRVIVNNIGCLITDEKLQNLNSWDADFGMDETEFDELYIEENWDMIKDFVR